MERKGRMMRKGAISKRSPSSDIGTSEESDGEEETQGLNWLKSGSNLEFVANPQKVSTVVGCFLLGESFSAYKAFVRIPS